MPRDVRTRTRRRTVNIGSDSSTADAAVSFSSAWSSADTRAAAPNAKRDVTFILSLPSLDVAERSVEGELVVREES